MGLSVKTKKYIYWGISFFSIIVILFSIYYQLGGFDEIKAGRSSSSSYSIAGQWVRGKAVRKEEGKIFYNLKERIEAEELKGILTLIDFKGDTLEEGEVSHFIGVILDKEITALPSGLEIIELEAKTTYKASLTMHPLVMPNTRAVEKKLSVIANTNGERLRPITIEMFFEDNSVMVEMFAY